MSKNRKRIWFPEMEFNPIKKQTVKLPIHIGSFAGYVKIDLIDAKSGKIKEHYEFPNVIVSGALDAMGAGDIIYNTFIEKMVVGTGSTTPTPLDISLEAPVGESTDNGGFGDTSGYVTGSPHGPFLLGNPYHFRKTTRIFSESQANFALTELGFTSSLGLLNRALFKDSGGTPITINKTSVDELKVTYEMRMYPPTTHFFGEFVMADSNVSHSWTASAVNIDDSSVWGSDNVSGQRGWFNGFGLWHNSPVGRGEQVFVTASAPQNPTGTVIDWGWEIDEDRSRRRTVARRHSDSSQHAPQ